MTELAIELTVADIIERLGVGWPSTDPNDEPRHLLVEPEPEHVPGALAELWFGPPEAGPDHERPSLVRSYVLPVERVQ